MANMSARNVTLQEVNDDMAILLVPAMLYLAIMMLTGFLGNVLVVYVFPAKLSSGTQNILITTLAVFDLLTCIIAIPTEITDMRFFFTFSSEFACKMLRFINSFCAMCSILILLGIAVDRFRKVCRPHQKQLGPKQIKIVIVVSVLIATFFAWPTILIYGLRTAETGIEGLTGKDCSTNDALKATLYPLIYNGILALMFIIVAIVLCVLYVLIWRTAKRHTQTSRPTPISGSKKSVTNIELSSADSETCSGPTKMSYSPNKTKPSRRRSNKTTTIAFLVTIVFILSFLPYLCLSITRALVKDFDYNLNSTGTVFFNIFLRSYFVNSAANPIIYGVMNIRFRRECCKVLKQVFCCGRLS